MITLDELFTEYDWEAVQESRRLMLEEQQAQEDNERCIIRISADQMQYDSPRQPVFFDYLFTFWYRWHINGINRANARKWKYITTSPLMKHRIIEVELPPLWDCCYMGNTLVSISKRMLKELACKLAGKKG